MGEPRGLGRTLGLDSARNSFTSTRQAKNEPFSGNQAAILAPYYSTEGHAALPIPVGTCPQNASLESNQTGKNRPEPAPLPGIILALLESQYSTKENITMLIIESPSSKPGQAHNQPRPWKTAQNHTWTENTVHKKGGTTTLDRDARDPGGSPAIRGPILPRPFHPPGWPAAPSQTTSWTNGSGRE